MRLCVILRCGAIYSKARCRGVGYVEARCSKTDDAAPLLEESGTYLTFRQWRSLVSKNSKERTEYAMQQLGATSHDFEHTWLSRNHAGLA